MGLIQAVIKFKSARYLYAVISILILATSNPCIGDQANPVILYIEEAGLSFKELIDRVSVHTGYRINLVGEWPDATINTQLKGIALEDGLNSIIKELGNVSHVLIFDAKEKKIKIVRLHEGSGPDLAVTERSAVLSEDEISSSHSPPEEPELTHSQIAAIKEEYQEKLRNRTGDTEILPATEYGPALTLAEYEFIKSEYKLMLENENPDTVISPGSGDRPGITLGELEAIKQDHKTRQVTSDPLASPPY